MRRRRAALAVGLAIALLLVACGGDDDVATDETSTTSTTEAPSTTSSSTSTTTTSAEPVEAEIEDGRHAVYLVEVNEGGRTITFDLIQFLTGQAAIDAYHEEQPDDPDGPPNDYYLVNENDRLRTVPVADDVEVQVLRLHEDQDPDLDPGTFEELNAYTTAEIGEAEPPPDRLGFFPWWLTVENGEIVAMEEQFLP